MKFRTEIFPEKPDFSINHSDKIITFGSCFAQNIAEKFKLAKFQIMGNPFGVLFNPVSIYNSIKLLADEKIFTGNDLFYFQDEYHSFYHHSDFSHSNPFVCLEKINNTLTKTKTFISNADYVIITYGTAYIYNHKIKEITVSNCHKIPSNHFEKIMLTFQQTENIINNTISLLKNLNPKLKIIFTVSPVRHWKDGAVENQRSKATLLLAISKILGNGISYFPSYEILMDDLRDYRFYNEDLLHPNELAIDYVWTKFSETCFSETCLKLLPVIEKINTAYNHRPRNTESAQHKTFAEKILKQIENIQKEIPYTDFQKEKEYFLSIIH